MCVETDRCEAFLKAMLCQAGVRGDPVGWDTALQAGRLRVRVPMVSLEFFVDILFRPHCVPGVDTASNRNECQDYFLGGKAADAWDWQPHHLHVPIVLKCGSLNLLEPSGPVQACNGIALPLYQVKREVLDDRPHFFWSYGWCFRSVFKNHYSSNTILWKSEYYNTTAVTGPSWPIMREHTVVQ